jgi:methionyl-tRNA formyltransferase
MRIIALGTSQFLISCVSGLIKSGHEIVCLVSEPIEIRPVNSIDIEQVAKDLGSVYFETDDINSSDASQFLQSLNPDIIFSSWPRIIGEKVLNLSKYGVIGSHPTPLPANRGRHPFHWQIVLGLRNSMLSFFKMDKGIDSGKILLQIPYDIDQNDTVNTLSERVNALALKASTSIGKMLSDVGEELQGEEQDHQVANTWRKRTLYDVTIDFRINWPFSGALIVNKKSVYHVMDGRKSDSNNVPENFLFLEHGNILHVEDNLIRVKASDCILDLITKENLKKSLKLQKYFHPPLKYIADNPSLLKSLK